MSHLGPGVKHGVETAREAVFQSNDIAFGTFRISQHQKEEGHRENQDMKLSMAGSLEAH